MTGPRDVEAYQAAKRIMDYLDSHADAADAVEGIAAWWLTDGPPLPTATIERALRYLAAEGHVERQSLPDGTVVYRRRRGVRPEL